MIKKMNKKAFTLIELIVTIAVLGVLVLLASPIFFGHTQNAELTKGFANARSIEKASELYYMDNNDWPRLTDDPYTSEEVESYSERIFNHTGQEINLDPEGNYYDIDYDKLSEYIQIPDDKKNYILQNPVGKVFYMDNLNETGVARVNYSSTKEKDDNPGEEGLMNPIDSRKPTEGEIAIATADELAKIGTSYPLDGAYILTSNINLSGYSKEEGWTPIGNNDSKFTGSFDGNGYSITGLTINRPTENYVGLFGSTEKATIRNVGLIDNKVTGGYNVGSLVGYARDSTISNSYATGSVEGTRNNVGGLVGSDSYSTVENSYATGSVEGTKSVGGLVGYAHGRTISKSYSTGEVTGTGNYVGGLVGEAHHYSKIIDSYSTGGVTGAESVGGFVGKATASTIENSYATGSITGASYVGGFVGRAENDTMASTKTTISSSYSTGEVTGTGMQVGGLVGYANGRTISNSYSTGSVTGKGHVGGLVGSATNSTEISNSYSTGSATGTESVGGLVGHAYSYSTIIDSYATGLVEGSIAVGGLVGSTGSSGKIVTRSYWDKETSRQSTSAGGTGKTTDEMKKQTTYSGWDFDTVWKIDEGKDYPKLR